MARDDKEKDKAIAVPKGATIDSLRDAINKHFKSSIANVASDIEKPGASLVHLYPTGILSLDKYLGIGGILGGRIVNIWGWEGCGKTLTALTVAAHVQKLHVEPYILNTTGKARVAFLDAEGTYSPGMARAIGANPDEILLVRSTPEKTLSGEDYFQMMSILIQNGIEMIIVDSCPALEPSTKLTARIGEGRMASHAGMMAEGIQQVNTFLNAYQRSTVWFINQVRAKPGQMFGNPEDHTGGNALRFFSSYSIEVKKRDSEEIVAEVPLPSGNGWEKRTIGVRIRATLHKNKTAPIPQDHIEYDVYFENVKDKSGIEYQAGVDIYSDVVNTALLAGIVKQQSSYYSYGTLRTNGIDAFIRELRSAPALLDDIREEVLHGTKTVDVKPS